MCVFNSPKNENNSTWGTIVVKSTFFVRFLGELKIPKRHFEINWPLPSELFYRFNIIFNEIISSHCIDGGVKTNSCKMRRRVTTSLISFLPWTAIVKVLVSVVIMICDSNYCCNISGRKSSRAVRCGRLLRDADKTAQSTMGKNNSIKFGNGILLSKLWEKIVLVIEKNFWNSRLKAENLQNCWNH